VPYTSPSGQQGEVSGAWLGLAFSLSVEHALRSNGASAR
jgi:hypothetical protein